MRLDELDHNSLLLWAASCAEHVLPYFKQQYPKDNRTRNALEASRAWVRGEIATSEARTAAFAAHAPHAANYAVTAATDSTTAKERDWQYNAFQSTFGQ